MTITPIALDSIGWKFYLMWAIFNFSFIPMVYFLYPETKGLHLEQIDHIFEGGSKGLGRLTQGVRQSIKNPPHVGVGGSHSDEEKATVDLSERASQSNGSKDDMTGTTANVERAT